MGPALGTTRHGSVRYAARAGVGVGVMLARMARCDAAARRPVVLAHGYSAGPGSFDVWRRVLEGHCYDPRSLLSCHYEPDVTASFRA